EDAIGDTGGINFQILGIGKTGHIGFNEPGSGSDSRTRLVTLDAITRLDAAADFFGEEYVPREAITMGVATILDAKEIAILATGEHKSSIVQRAVEGEVDVEVAATFLQRHGNTTFYVDQAAAAELTRIATPWLIDEGRWTPELMVRAVIWLSREAKKAILKLTQRDYDVRRYVDFLERLGKEDVLERKSVSALARRVHEFLGRKRPGEVDIKEVQDIKRIIRESEAVSGLETVGLPKSAARFLNLPFYQTGKVRK